MLYKKRYYLRLNYLNLFQYYRFFEKYYTTISIFILFLIILSCLYLDLKNRKIHNKNFICFFLLSILLVIIEFSYYNSIYFLMVKLLYFITILALSILLFALKIIGGSDGKLCILIFLVCPIKIITFSKIILFYEFFLFIFMVFLLINYSINHFSSRKNSFNLLFKFYMKDIRIKKIFIQSTYIPLNLIELEKKKKKFLKKINILFYNNKSEKFQILVQYRPPLVLFLLFSYIFLLI